MYEWCRVSAGRLKEFMGETEVPLGREVGPEGRGLSERREFELYYREIKQHQKELSMEMVRKSRKASLKQG